MTVTLRQRLVAGLTHARVGDPKVDFRAVRLDAEDCRRVLDLLAAAREHRVNASIVGYDFGPSERLDAALAAFERNSACTTGKDG